MSQRIKTTKEAIANYWAGIYPEANLCDTKCWCCGIKRRLDRAHIQALSIDGQDAPDNFVLLCKHCHINAPNVDDPYYMWQWLNFFRQRDIKELWMYEGIEMFNRLYHQDFRVLVKGHEVEFYVAFKEAVVHATRHFGQPSLNPSTVASVIHASLLQLKLI